MRRRRVRIAEDALDELAFLLPEERGADGQLSFTDFLAYELPPLLDALGQDSEANTMPTGNKLTRSLHTFGVFVQRICLYAYLESPESVVVLGFDLSSP